MYIIHTDYFIKIKIAKMLGSAGTLDLKIHKNKYSVKTKQKDLAFLLPPILPNKKIRQLRTVKTG